MSAAPPTQSAPPFERVGTGRARRLAVSLTRTFVLQDDGALLRWEPGGTYRERYEGSPGPVPGGSDLLDFDGNFAVFDDFQLGSLRGNGALVKSLAPSPGARRVASSLFGHAVCVIDGGGAVRCSYGDSSAPFAPVSGLTEIAQIEVEKEEACALGRDGELQCWTPAKKSPVKRLDHVISFALTTSRGCAVRDGGDVLCWGRDDHGLPRHEGDLDPTRPLPTAVHDAVSLDLRPSGGCAVLRDGGVTCWGDARGIFSVGPREEPKRIPWLTDVESLALGAGQASPHLCAILRTGEARCWTLPEPKRE
jgi:hypothetical protein